MGVFFCGGLNSFSRFLNIFHVSSCVARGRWGRMFHGWRDPKGSGNSPWTFRDFIHPRQGKRLECARVTRFLPTANMYEYVTLNPPSNPKNGIFQLETLWNPMNQVFYMFFEMFCFWVRSSSLAILSIFSLTPSHIAPHSDTNVEYSIHEQGWERFVHIHKYSIDSDRLLPRDTKLVHLNLSQEGYVSI